MHTLNLLNLQRLQAYIHQVLPLKNIYYHAIK